jgi:geranylgeranyl diphosphate synthase, type I
MQRMSTNLDRKLQAFVGKQPLDDFYELMRYEFGWNSPESEPMLHPHSVLCLHACQACGGTPDVAMPMAMAVALLHRFARIQEDVERRREVSRGRPAVWSLWGTPQAMNAGDGMHALAKMALLEGRGSISAGTILELEEELDESCLRLCEVLHLELQGPDAPAAVELAARKSAVLFGCAAYAGCHLAGGDESRRQALRRFGELIGSAAGARPLSEARARAFYDEALLLLSDGSVIAAAGPSLRAFAEYLLTFEI